ncbi:MAG: DUF1993 domain-containing protein [Burkholderiales bacterium]
MALSMYQASVPVYTKMLNGLANCLKKAAAHYMEHKYDEASLLNFRLFPDMFHFAKQVQEATNHARNVVRLAGQEPPQVEENEKSLAELIARVDETVAFMNTLKAEQIDGSEDKVITLTRRDVSVNYSGMQFLLNRSIPNFCFHCTTAYNILRHNGVAVGKRDYLGPA